MNPPASPKAPFSRKALLADLFCNMLFPWLGYEALRGWGGCSEFQALLWITVVPAGYGLVVLLWERRVSLVAGLSLFGLLLSLGSAMASQDTRMLQIRESFCTGLFGLLFVGSALVKRPLIWLMMREQGGEPARLERLWADPAGRRFIYAMTWGMGGLMLGEFFIKWWMIEHLPIATVLWLGPLVLKILTALTVLGFFLGARALRRSLGARPATHPGHES